MSTEWEIAVVGGGVAGLTAARVAAEAGRRVIAYDRLSPGGQLVNLTTLHDYPEPGGSAEPWALISELVARAEAAGVTMSFDEVTRVHAGAPARLETSGGEVTAGAVVIATGLTNGRLGLPGEEALVGRGLSTCAGCDGPLYRGKAVAVVGDDEWTAEEALELAELASSVTVLVPGTPRWSPERDQRLTAADRVEVLTGAMVTGLRADGVLQGVTVRTGDGERELPVQGVFPYVGRSGPVGLVDGLPADAEKRLLTEDGVRTAVPTVFVAGDARAGAAQTLLSVVADGAAAGQAAVAALRPAGGGPAGGGLRIVDPTFGVLPDDADVEVRAGGTADWTQVALFTNSKPNATELLRGVGERLQAHWDLRDLGFASKDNASAAADKDTIDWLSQNYKMVVVAVGD
ncbi:pyridine nucleotide-disulfide oxidoreductase [Blastococcus sp. CT_GayMR19]|uniref:NAD(P)/FAD-dependent oxidoreductase n=1 Tax=Blastococcus sp. CT_GayMR19 TaxID=2559608 RepID=UPI0010737F01|nr:NAD(P)/FAD-dependent oxidoreductase [Blastococcus sp. CT_GayMR19]TFV74435.1 pyridine nucleotide-disulfide oxidoreductase [Blastococcus sp. CT_GayMR19]